MKKLKLYYIDNDYIDYLRQFDKVVPYNKNGKRPYIGIVYIYNNFNYFAPLSSPKEKHLKMKYTQLDIFKIDGGKLGVVNINNMIPSPKKCLIEALPMIIDEKYRNLLIDQLSFLNKTVNLRKLSNKVNQFQKEYRERKLPQNILKRSCNFVLLEKLCLVYK